MVMKKLPGVPKLFAQRDVRETTTSPKAEVLHWSCAGMNFKADNPDTDQIHYVNNAMNIDADGITVRMPVSLPHGAVDVEVIVYGNATAAAESYLLKRTAHDGVTTTMALKTINTADTTITNPIIDNAAYFYNFQTTSLDTNDRIYGARITYTLG